MKKHFIKFALLLSLLLSVSCKNLFENSVNSDEDKIENTGAAISASNPAPEKRTCVQFSGRLEYNNSGASPSEINSILENTNSNQTSSVSSERSANPSIPTVTSNADCQYEYYIKATPNSGQAREEIASLVDGAWQYNITLEIGKTWTFEAGLRKKAQGTFGEDDYVGPQTLLIDFESDAGHPFFQALTETTTNIEKTFILKPRQNGGYGKIDLAMKKVPSTVNQMIIKIYDSNGTEQTALLGKLEYGIDSSTDAGNFIQSVSEGDNEYIFPSGIYDFVITFSQGYGTEPNRVYFPVYTTTQTVAVFDNMTTCVWKNGNSSASYSVIDSSGNFELTSNILQHYANTTLYVGKFSNTAADASDNGNSGSPFEPLATLTGAFNKIQANQNLQTGSDIYAYRIILCENQTGNFEIPAAIIASKVSSIDISSYNTRTVLNGGNSGTVLAINSTVPVTLSNVQITGGNAENGGGISMASGTKLTLGAGALVGRDVQTLAGSGTSDHGNYATGFGAGIYVENATLILKNGSKVCNNYLDSSAVLSGGGGIALCGGSLTIENGAAVSWNKSAARAGGIMVPYTATTASTITMKGGEISHNEAGRYGGGVIIGHTGGTYSAKTFNLSGGTISENNVTETGSKPSRGGAGVFFDGGNFTMSGNAVIEKNTASGCGGGISISASGEASGTFTMTGGIIRNNSAGTGGAIYFDDVSDELSEKSYSISGSASIPYGVDGTQGNGKNDVYIGKTGSLEIAAALNDTFPDTGIYSNNWKRGTPILKLASGVTVTEAFVDKLKCTFPSDDWEKIISTDKVSVNCPFYVGSYNGTAGLDTNPGTKISPYATIEKACQQMTDKDTDYIIKIIGTTATEQQKIPAELKKDGSGTYNANSIKLLGADSSAVINRGLSTATSGSDDGTALLIESPVPVFLSNLKITGGFSSTSGGGLQLNSGTELHIESDTVIESNKAASGAGIHINQGTLYITGGEIKKNSTTLADDTNGGGIYNYNGNLYITGGKISENNAQLGGAIFVYAGDDNTKISGTATIEKGSGTAESPLNDICVWAGKLNIPSDITNHDTTSSKQIALRVRETKEKGSQIIAGAGVASAYQKFDLIPGGYKFDSDGKLQLKNIVTSIYVKQGTAQNPVTDPSGNTKNGSTWNNYDYSYNASTSNSTKPFASIDKALQFITYQGSASAYTIYIDGAFTGLQTIASNSDTNNPITMTTSYASQITLQGNTGYSTDILNGGKQSGNAVDNGSTLTINTDIPIYIKKLGITGGNTTGNGGGINITHASAKVYIQDKVRIYSNTAAVNGGGIYHGGSELCISKDSVIGKDDASSTLPLSNPATGYNKAVLGGGIYCASSSKLYLGHSVANSLTDWSGGIYYNWATDKGGGVYSDGGDIYMAAGTIGFNRAGTATDETGYGGGIYSLGTIYLCKTAIVGYLPSTPTTASETDNSNYACFGGGIYCKNSSVYLGYKKSGSSETLTGGVYRNYSKKEGGGIDCRGGSVDFKTGNVSYNATDINSSTCRGGGLYISGSGSISMSGGTIASNHSGQGGGIYASSPFTMSGGVIGDSSKQETSGPRNTSNFSNYAHHEGGGIYLAYSKSTDTADFTAGTIAYNSSAQKGGGIYFSSSSNSSINISNTINYNYAGSYGGGGLYLGSKTRCTLENASFTLNKTRYDGGGAVCVDGANNTFVIKDGVSMPSSAKLENDIYLEGVSSSGGLVLTVGEKLNGSGVITGIACDSYTDGNKVIAIADGVTDMNLSDAVARFKLYTPDSTNYSLLNDATMLAGQYITSVTANTMKAALENVKSEGETLVIKENFFSDPAKATNIIANALKANYTSYKVKIDVRQCTPSVYNQFQFAWPKVTEIICNYEHFNKGELFQDCTDLQYITVYGDIDGTRSTANNTSLVNTGCTSFKGFKFIDSQLLTIHQGFIINKSTNAVEIHIPSSTDSLVLIDRDYTVYDNVTFKYNGSKQNISNMTVTRVDHTKDMRARTFYCNNDETRVWTPTDGANTGTWGN